VAGRLGSTGERGEKKTRAIGGSVGGRGGRVASKLNLKNCYAISRFGDMSKGVTSADQGPLLLTEEARALHRAREKKLLEGPTPRRY